MKTLLTTDPLIVPGIFILLLLILLVCLWNSYLNRNKELEKQRAYFENISKIHAATYNEQIQSYQSLYQKMLRERNELKERVAELEAGKKKGVVKGRSKK